MSLARPFLDRATGLPDESVALLAMLTVPVELPLAAGAKATLRVALCPGARIVPEGIPPALKAGPEMLTLEIVTLVPPVLAKLTPSEPVSPKFIFPNAKLDWLALNCPAVEVMAEVTAPVI